MKYLIVITIENMFFWLPMKNNRIVLYAHARKGYTCNPKYIAEYLLENYPGQYELIWVSCYPETCRHLEEKSIKVVKAKTLKHFYYTMTARVNITNDFWFFNRKEQLSINTWHGGGAYKKSGMAITGGIERLIHSLTYRYTDYIISSSEEFTKNGKETFGYEKEKFLPIGMPRNDIFFHETNEIKEKIYNKYSLSNEVKILLYAPTFREKNTLTMGILTNYELIIDALKYRFDGNWVLFYRGHYFENNIENIAGDFINVSDYDDIQELLCAAEVLITDYSSSIWDFGLTGKPCFLYAPDLERYLYSERQFYTPIESWPYSLSKTVDALKNNINFFDEINYSEKLKEHYFCLSSYEKGTASQETAKMIVEYCEQY